MIAPFAHAGRRLAGLAYLAPLLFLAGSTGWGKLKDRRATRHGSAA